MGLSSEIADEFYSSHNVEISEGKMIVQFC